MSTPEPELERWYGIFRAVDREPLGDARMPRIESLRKAIRGKAAVIVVSSLLSPLAVIGVGMTAESAAWLAAGGMTILPCVVAAAYFVRRARRRLRALAEVASDTPLEHFSGVVDDRAEDAVTSRLIARGEVEAGATVTITVITAAEQPLEIDGKDFRWLGPSAISVTTKLRDFPVEAMESLRLSEQEKIEAMSIARRWRRPRYVRSLLLGWITSALLLGLFTGATGAGDLSGLLPWLWLGPLLVAGIYLGIDRLRARQRTKALLRDLEIGLAKDGDIRRLQGCDLVWQVGDTPGPERLVDGGLIDPYVADVAAPLLGEPANF